MKKLFYLMVLLGFISSATAQDTILFHLPPENYLIWHKEGLGYNWVDADTLPEIELTSNCAIIHPDIDLSEYTIGYFNLPDLESWCGGMAFQQYTEDTLQVYGIAAAVSCIHLIYWDNPFYSAIIMDRSIDTTLKNVYSLLRLYEADPDSLRELGGGLVVRADETPSYYFDLKIIENNNCVLSPILPMYERYYQEPIPVTDSFYVGIRPYSGRHVEGDSRYNAPPMCVSFITFAGDLNDASYAEYHDTIHLLTIDTVTWEIGPNHDFDTDYYHWTYEGNFGFPLFFPILTPQKPNQEVGLDDNIDMLHRYTTVSPNPASESARVLSSFGIESIEAFDATGRKVYNAKCSGYTFTINTSTWAKGTYILHIHTQTGTVVEKLVVN